MTGIMLGVEPPSEASDASKQSSLGDRLADAMVRMRERTESALDSGRPSRTAKR